jgi:hypothetical protein
MPQANEPNLRGIASGTPSPELKAKLEQLRDSLKSEGFMSTAEHLQGLLHETDAVITSHPRVLTDIAIARPTPGGGDF